MEKEKAVSLAKEIIELDMKRDEMLEAFMQLAGNMLFRCSEPSRTDFTEKHHNPTEVLQWLYTSLI